jgi:hypothetical protein
MPGINLRGYWKEFFSSFLPGGYDHALHIQFYLNEQKAKIMQSNRKETKKILNPYNKVKTKFMNL